MWRIRPRFSLKTLLAAFALVAVASYFLVLPTIRAQRFAALIRSGQRDIAEAMLPSSTGQITLHRMTLRRATRATLEALTIDDLLRGERKVIVGGAVAGEWSPFHSSAWDNAEFVISRTSVATGWHGLARW